MDVFVTYCYQDEEFASGLEDDLSGRGLIVGNPLSLWPGERLLPPIDRRLFEARHAIVVISRAFLASSWPRKELDGLTIRRKVVTVLSGVAESDVAGHSPRLAVAAFPASLSERLVRLLRPREGPG